MPEAVALEITSEDEAWAYLEQALNGQLPENLVPAVAFKKWPLIDIYLPDTEVEGSVSPSMMVALVDFQRAIYRTHSLITTGERTARISKAEKVRLEFRVQVEKGSSQYLIDLTEIARSWGVAAVGRMTPEQTMIAIIVAIVALAGTTGLGLWLKHRTDVRKAELDAKGQEHLFDAFNNLTEQDTKRQEMLFRAIQQLPVLSAVKDEADSARAEIVRAIADEGGGRLDGVQLPADVANDLTTTTRKKADEETVRSTFRVARVDTTTPDGFRVGLRDVATGEEVTASLMDALISDQHRQRIRAAEWSKQPVVVELRKRVSRGRTIEATVVDVQEVREAS